MFDWLENIWNGIKDFFGFFASVKEYIEYFFDMLRAGRDALMSLYSSFPLPSAVVTICIAGLAMCIVLRVVNRD